MEHILRYKKYIHEDLSSIDIDTATYKEHLHKSFEWFACIQLSIQYNSIFLRWEDVPPQKREEKGMNRDMGIDAWDIEGNRVSQMKLYQGCISWRHFSTFLGCCFKFKDADKILYRTKESQLCSLIQSYINDKTIIDTTISGLDFRTECKLLQALTFPSPTLSETIDIRPYQTESISYLEKGTEKNVYLCIPTGCGKTVIILQYHRYHSESLLVLVPRIVLMEQWGEECMKLGIKSYLIGTGHHHNMEQYQDETIVICVYDSFPNIYEQKDQFRRYCIDEAHHIKTPERYMDNDLEHQIVYDEEDDDDKEDEEDSLSYMECIQSLSDSKRVIYISATLDPPEDDSLFYEYKVRQAIDEGYLCDYQFVFPIFEQEYVTNEHLARYLVHKQHESHCVIYAPSCQEGQEFCQFLNQLKQGCAGYIDAHTSYKERKRLFADFESGSIQFLVNIRILVEGFNAPHIRSIFFLKVSSNEIFIIQAIGRALRPHLDKQIATIYVPFTHENDLERIQTFISQLASYDERVKKSIVEKKIGGYISMERGENDNEDEEDEEEKVFDFRYNLVVDRMGESDQYEKIWMKRLEELKEFIEKKGCRPKDGRKEEKGKKVKNDNIQKEETILHNWLGTQKQNYKKNMYTMKNDSIKKIWEEFINDEKYKKIMLDKDELWFYNLNLIKKYMDKHGRPSCESKDDYIKFLGNWIVQNQVYNKSIKSYGDRLKSSNRLTSWNEFINDEKYKKYFISSENSWLSKLDMVKIYIDNNEDRPTYYKCKTKEDKELGKWLDHQQSNYNTKTDIVYNNTQIKLIWEQFISDEKYKKYFMTQEEIWLEKLDNCKQFIGRKKLPDVKSKIDTERTMAYWIKTQIGNYRDKRGILGKSESLQKLWIPFVSDIKKLQYKLTFDDEIQIISGHDNGITNKILATKYNVSTAYITLIIKDREKYKNVINT